MKIFVIHGSMRKGNTYKLTQEVIKQLKTYPDVQIDEIGVNDLDLPFCLSCHMCFKEGEHRCPHYGVMRSVAEQIQNCDALIVSGVVYSLHLNAAMKNLIDHLSYYFHRPCLFEKHGLVVTTTAGAAENTVAKYLSSVLSHWGISGVRRLSCKIQTENFVLNEKQKARVERVTNSFYKSVKQSRLSSPPMEALIVHNAFRAMSSLERPPSERDKAYWQETGLIKRVYPRNVNALKTAFGALVFRVMRGVMSKNFKNDKK